MESEKNLLGGSHKQHPPGLHRLSLMRISGILTWACAYGLMNLSVSCLGLPAETKRLGGDRASWYTSIASFGVLGMQLVALCVCFLSDRTTLRMGRRRPYLIAVVLGGFAACILWMWASKNENLTWVIGAYWILNAANISGFVVLQALIPDLILPSQHGIAGGFVGLWEVFGTAIGYIFFVFIESYWKIWICYAAMGIVFAIPTLMCAKETPLVVPRRAPGVSKCSNFFTDVGEIASGFVFNPIHNIDWTMLLAVRFLYSAGLYVAVYLQYYGYDVLEISDYEAWAGYVSLVALAIAVFVSFPAGYLSDRFGRKPFLCLCLVSVGGSMASMAFITDARIIWGIIIIYGMGLGMFSCTTTAIACDVMPRTRDSGKFMAMTVLFATCGSFMGSAIYGQILDNYPAETVENSDGSTESTGLYSHTGYKIMYLTAGGCCTAALFITLLISTRRGKLRQDSAKGGYTEVKEEDEHLAAGNGGDESSVLLDSKPSV